MLKRECRIISVLCLFLILASGAHVISSAISVSQENPRIGLGVTGQNPMNFTAGIDVGELNGYIRVINDGGTDTGYYEISTEGQIAALEGWTITVEPQSFLLEPNESRKVDVSIHCPTVEGTYAGRLRVSAHAQQNSTGTGVAEISVPISVTLTPTEKQPVPIYLQWWLWLCVALGILVPLTIFALIRRRT